MSEEKFTSPKTILFDLVLTGLFFLFMTNMLRPFVPAETPMLVWGFAAFTAVPITGVFWLASQMFRVTLTDQLRRNKVEKGA